MIFACWILVTISYILTFVIAVYIGESLHLEFTTLQKFVGGMLIIVPYIVAGIYAKKVLKNPIKGAILVSVIPVICERVLIYSLGFYYASKMLRPGWNWLNVIYFVQLNTPAFYFTTPYILLGFVSIMISVRIARRRKSV